MLRPGTLVLAIRRTAQCAREHRHTAATLNTRPQWVDRASGTGGVQIRLVLQRFVLAPPLPV